ncbi:MAG: energy transducer TonB [Myxococcota bacterium]
MVFPEFPAAAVGKNTERTQCEVKVDVAPSGVVGEVEIRDCDEVFRPDLERTVRRWRFGSPQVDNVPSYSGVTVAVQFRANVDHPDQPGEARVAFPPDPDLGERTVKREDRSLIADPTPEPMPTKPPLFVVNHKSYAEIRVHGMVWPEPPPAEAERSCGVLFQVNSKRQVLAWPETCDPGVLDATSAAAQEWKLVHGKIEPGERYARFRGTFVFPAGGGHPLLRIPAEDLETPIKDLPEFVETYTLPHAIKTVPPRLPDAFASEVLDDIVLCDYDVTVDRKGRPETLQVRQCPGAYQPYAEKAVRAWRWAPAAARGQAIASQVTVRIRFDQG